MKKRILSAIIVTTIALGATCAPECSAIEEIATPLTKKELKEQHKLEKKTKKQSNNLYTEEINKNILTPNISPGFMNNTEKTRRYYESFEGAHRTEIEKAIEEPVIVDEVLKLPARIVKDATTTLIKKVEFSSSEIFTELELYQFKLLLEGQNVTAEDINNFICIINSQYAKKKIITARAILESLEAGVLKIELMEARIGSILVEGNKFNKKWFIKKQISSKPSDVLNLQILEEDLRTFNKNARSIKLSAKLQPGKEYGTTDIILKAVEEFPYY